MFEVAIGRKKKKKSGAVRGQRRGFFKLKDVAGAGSTGEGEC